jgi:hypothetical protein
MIAKHTPHAASSKRILEPVDRISEVHFGLILAPTFTSVPCMANAGRKEVREMRVGAPGCNLVWGVVDGATACGVGRSAWRWRCSALSPSP